MLIEVQKHLLNYSTTVLKTVTRKYALPVVTQVDQSEKAIYPPIWDLSRKGKIKSRKEEWHNKIKKLESVEEKLFGINMPHYYGWKSLYLEEGNIKYNSLPQAQYITHTHVMEIYTLPDFYDNLITSDQLNTILQTLREPIENMIRFENYNSLRKRELANMDEKKLQNYFANALIYRMDTIIQSGLASIAPHLFEAQVDFEPRVEAFWFAGGMEPSNLLKKARSGLKWMKEYVNDPVDMPVQYLGSPVLQLRHQFPLKEILPLSECNDSDISIPQAKYDPRTLGYTFKHRHGTNIPGFWPGDPAEFGLLSYHNSCHLLNRPKTYMDDHETLKVQAIYASYSWLLSQACYQGFSTVNDITYPLVSQTIITNGQWWTFCAYQLNTTLLHSEHADQNPTYNICWITEPMKLFDTVEDETIYGFNEDVLKNLFKFYMNTPKERIGVDMKPYLGKSIKHIADIPEVERRTWLEKQFKYIMSNRPRHYQIPEVATWQKIYLIDHQTRPMDRKRDPWQFGYRPMKRRMDDHKPIYIPRCLRKRPNKRKIGRWAKTYYPDA